MRISLVRFFKTFQKYLAYGFYTYLANAILGLFMRNAILFAIYFVTAIIR